MSALEVVALRADESPEKVLHELMGDADLAIPVDCAPRRVQFVVNGWFICPKGSLLVSEVTGPT